MHRILYASVCLSLPVMAAAPGSNPADETWKLPPVEQRAVTPPASAKSEEPPLESEERAPDESWTVFPGASTAPAGAASGSEQTDVPAMVSEPPPPPAATTARRLPRTPEEPNKVSVYGAPALGQWKRGLGLYIGFPLLGIRAAVGLTDKLDVGLGFDSFYGPMNEVRVHAKYAVFEGRNWSIAAAFEAGKAFFSQPPSAETNGARWLTGRRNWNFAPGFIVSYQGDLPRSARLFLDARYLVALDTQPFQRDPLGGVPASLQVGHNVPVRFGAEMPFTRMTSFLFTLGFDVHGRPEDSNFMPVCAVGIVTSI